MNNNNYIYGMYTVPYIRWYIITYRVCIKCLTLIKYQVNYLNYSEENRYADRMELFDIVKLNEAFLSNIYEQLDFLVLWERCENGNRFRNSVGMFLKRNQTAMASRLRHKNSNLVFVDGLSKDFLLFIRVA